LPKSIGGQGFQEKLPGGSASLGFYCIFINNSFEIRVEGPHVYPLLSPLTLPLCASMVQALIYIVSVTTGIPMCVHCTMYEAAFVAFVYNHLQKIPTGSSKEISTRYSESLVSLNNENQLSLSIEIT
jgi:hypothetical protein